MCKVSLVLGDIHPDRQISNILSISANKHLLINRAPTVNFQNIMINNEPNLKINQLLKPLHILSNKQIYLELVNRKSKPPTSIETWLDIYPFMESYDWRDIFQIPFTTTKEPYSQSFQF